MGAIPIGFSFSSTAVMVGDPTWTRVDDTYKVTQITIDRGRSFELDKTGTGSAVVELVDETGVFAPSDPLIDCMYHAAVALEHPISGATATLFRGYVDSVQWTPYVSGGFANVRIEIVDALAVLAAIELPVDGSLSGSTVSVVAGNLSFPELDFTDAVQRRIGDGTHYGGLLSDIGWPTSLRQIFTGNVKLQKTVYAPRTSALAVLMDAADAEHPAVANLYVNKSGQVTVHGRLARFDPVATSSDSAWDFNDWNLGDTNSASTVVPVSPPVTVYRDTSHIYTSALALPMNVDDGDIAGQYVTSASTATYGVRSWSAEGLATLGGTSNNALQETYLFAQYITDNFSAPTTRVGALTIVSQEPTSTHGEAVWDLLCNVDISDRVRLDMTLVGQQVFSNNADNRFFVEGVRYQIVPLNANHPEVTLTLDVSPAEYFSNNPF